MACSTPSRETRILQILAVVAREKSCLTRTTLFDTKRNCSNFTERHLKIPASPQNFNQFFDPLIFKDQPPLRSQKTAELKKSIPSNFIQKMVQTGIKTIYPKFFLQHACSFAKNSQVTSKKINEKSKNLVRALNYSFEIFSWCCASEKTVKSQFCFCFTNSANCPFEVQFQKSQFKTSLT